MQWNEKHLLKVAVWFFDHYDRNDDNELDNGELVDLLAGAKGMISTSIAQAGGYFPDINVTRLADQMMEDLDADSSSTLDVAEFQDAFIRLMKHWLAASNACTELRDQMRPFFEQHSPALPTEFCAYIDANSAGWTPDADEMW